LPNPIAEDLPKRRRKKVPKTSKTPSVVYPRPSLSFTDFCANLSRENKKVYDGMRWRHKQAAYVAHIKKLGEVRNAKTK